MMEKEPRPGSGGGTLKSALLVGSLVAGSVFVGMGIGNLIGEFRENAGCVRILRDAAQEQYGVAEWGKEGNIEVLYQQQEVGYYLDQASNMIQRGGQDAEN